MSVMWNDWSNRTADSAQAACSSRQFVYSSAIGKTYFITGAVRSIASGLSCRWSWSSRLSFGFIRFLSVEMSRSGKGCCSGPDAAAAVHAQGLAGDEGGLVGEQEADARGDLLRAAEPALGDAVQVQLFPG